MVNEYISIAENFLKNHNATMSIEFCGETFNPWNDGLWHNTYSVTIKRNEKRFSTDFHASAYDSSNGTKPNVYDVLACLQKWDVGSYIDFCLTFGYKDNDSSLAMYYACKEEYDNLNDIFYDCMDELQNIN